MKNNKKKVYVLILSIICLLSFSFIPNIGLRIEENSYYWGFPADWLGIHQYGGFSFMWLGFLFNIAFFYSIFWLMTKSLSIIKKMKIK